MEIKIGNKKIVSSGTVLLTSNENLEFEFEEYFLKFIFQFKKSIEQQGAYYSTELVPDGSHLLVTLFNFDNELNIGNQVPITLAQVEGNALSLKFRVTPIGQENPDIIFNYSWYLNSEEATNVK